MEGVKRIYNNRGFTLLEVVIVALIIGILATFATPQFVKTKEITLNKEAQASLSQIQAAERIYKMEQGSYYPSSGTIDTSTTANRDLINTNLKLSLPSATNWKYTLNPSVPQATATRNDTGARVWTIGLASTDSDVPTCSGC